MTPNSLHSTTRSKCKNNKIMNKHFPTVCSKLEFKKYIHVKFCISMCFYISSSVVKISTPLDSLDSGFKCYIRRFLFFSFTF